MHMLSTAKSKDKNEVSAPQWQAHPKTLSATCVASTLLLFLCAYAVQRFTFCTYTQTKINRFIQVQTHKARSTFEFLSNAGSHLAECDDKPIDFCVQILLAQIVGQKKKRLKSEIQRACCWSRYIFSFRWNTVKMDKVITYCAFLWCSDRERKKKELWFQRSFADIFLTH